MAGVIKVQFAMSRTDSVVASNTHNIPLKSLSLVQSQTSHCDVMPTIGTTEETVVFTDILVNGVVYLENMDATNNISYGTTTGDYPFFLKPGDIAYVRLTAGKTLYAKAAVAACVLRACQYPN